MPIPAISRRPAALPLALWLALLPLAVLSAHVVTGSRPGIGAFASSPSAGGDAVIPIRWMTADSGLSVACFFVANTSAPRADAAAWPRVTGVGLELPGSLRGFSLVAPLDQGWQLVEGAAVTIPGRGSVVVDVALIQPVNPMGHRTGGGPADLPGIGPGQAPMRGNGTRFCLSGPFPAAATIESLLNGVVVGFHGVDRFGPAVDVGLWDSPQRSVPLFP